jgi:uncharacterized protein YajQ (UPF0234 family)
MAGSSFDVESTVDFQEVRNAVDQAAKEIGNRYDLKQSGAKLTLEGEVMTLESAADFSLEQALDVLKTWVVRRGIDVKSLLIADSEASSGGRVRQTVEIQQGIPKETCKQIAAEIKKMKIKVQASIQGDSVRVTGKKRDDLQAAITHLKSLDLDVPLVFANYR